MSIRIGTPAAPQPAPGPREHLAPRVGIVLVNFECGDALLRCLESVRSLSYRDYFVVVIDNASPDGSGYELKRRLRGGGIELILNPENRGFAAACNIGIKHALARSASYVWLLNPDMSVRPDSLSRLMTAAAAYPGAVLGSKVLYAGSEPRRIWSAGGNVDLVARTVSMTGWNEIDDGRFDSERACDYIPGCSLLVPAAVLPVVGVMPEDYFLYFEETSWCFEMRRAGVELRYVPQSVVEHHFDDAKLRSPRTVYYYNRNERMFFFRYGSLSARLRLLAGTLFRDLPRATRALNASRSESEREQLRAQRAAFLDFLLLRRGRAAGA